MHHTRAFALTDLLAAVALIAVVLCLTLATPGCGGGGASDSDKHESAVRLRKIGQGLILYSQGNRDFYPGLGSDGNIVGNGANPADRLSILLKASMVKPFELISPIDTGKTDAAGGTATTSNFSFALLRIDADNVRRREWKQTINSRAAVVTDRNVGTSGGKDARSIAGGEHWQGNVLWNDNHCLWEMSNVLKQTEYSLHPTDNDDLFADDGSKDTNNKPGVTGADAAMVYQDATSYSHTK